MRRASGSDAGAMIAILNAGGVTQGQIAARTGFAQSTLSNYKRGVNTAQFASTFEKLADGLDMPPRLRQALGLSGDARRQARGLLAARWPGSRPTCSICNCSPRPWEGTGHP